MSDNYKIVPVEPNAHMLRVGYGIKDRGEIYSAMLQASPPAPSVEEIKQFILEAGQEIEFASRAHALLAQFEAMEKET